ncbi:MAG: DUF4097 family beta strand repeat-containing protein [Planctomycetota bacterium]
MSESNDRPSASGSRRAAPGLALLICVGLLLLTAGGCVFSYGGSSHNGFNVSEDGRGLNVDGVLLQHQRWVDVGDDVAGSGAISLASATGPITIEGQESGPVALQALVYSEFEGEGTVVRDGEHLRAESARGKVYINSWRGTLPHGRDLTLSSGTGKIELKQYTGGGLEVETGTSDLRLTEVNATSLDAESGTGDLLWKNVSTPRLEIETGTGSLSLDGGKIGRLEFDTGTGEIALGSVECEAIVGNSGTGTFKLTDCKVGSLKFNSGTGDLALRGGTCNELKFDSGTGDISLTGGVQVTGR